MKRSALIFVFVVMTGLVWGKALTVSVGETAAKWCRTTMLGHGVVDGKGGMSPAQETEPEIRSTANAMLSFMEQIG